MRQQLAQLHARLPVARKLSRAAQQRLVPFEKREPLARHQRLRRLLPAQFAQLRLVVEEVELRRTARHEQVNHPLRFRRELRRSLRQRIRRIERDRGASFRAQQLI
jgi:hypothetical protein